MLGPCLRRRTANYFDSTILGKAYKTHSVGGRRYKTSSYRPSISHEGEQEYAEKVRQLMRRVTQPVVLVTTELDGPNVKEQRGLTVSSFTTICLTPSPFICFSTRQTSRAADLIARRERFIVHLLPCTPESARIAEAFSKSDLASHSNETLQDPFKLGHWEWNDSWKLPVLGGVLGALHCKVEKFVKVGDHRLCIAEVEDIFEDESAAGTALSYCGRKYRKEGEPILLHDSNSED